jgi:hypothetical protein
MWSLVQSAFHLFAGRIIHLNSFIFIDIIKSNAIWERNSMSKFKLRKWSVLALWAGGAYKKMTLNARRDI